MRGKKKLCSQQTRTLVFDSMTEASTATTASSGNDPAGVDNRYREKSRPVKFINVRVGAVFILEGHKWIKSSFDHARKTGGDDTEHGTENIKIDPAMFVYPVL